MSQKLERFQKYLDLYEKLVKKNAGNFVANGYVEDVVQETYIKLYEHLDYLGDEIVKQWLLVVSGNIAKDYSRKGGSIEVVLTETLEVREMVKGVEDSAEESAEKLEKQEAARRLLRTACNLLYEKNPVWYYIMIDSCMLGMSSKEIAKVLGFTTTNVNVMKQRARSYLHKKLGDDFHEYF